MELLSIIIIILIVFILMKLSSLQRQLGHLEQLLKVSSKLENKKEDKRASSKTEQRSMHKRESEAKKVTTVMPKPTPQVSTKKEGLKPKVIEVKPIHKPKAQTPTLMERLQHFGDISLEEILFGNIILKVAIVAFILGIGLFLKYSIDKDWIPIWGRVLIGIAVGMGMLIAGIKMIGNKHKLFSETLFGGGIAVLYLSVFAAFALEGFMFISANYAFGAMILITILAGLISVRFDAKSTAIFGLIGGFATPFLLSTGSGNVVGLLSYMLMLNLGVLFVSVYKKWSLLAWLAFAITALSALGTVMMTVDDFVPLSLLYGAFFVVYSIVPFVNEIRQKQEALARPWVILFWANFAVAILSYLALFQHYGIELRYYALVTVALAGYLLGYAAVLAKKKLLQKNLFYIVLAQAIALLLVTPAFIFSGSSLTIVWAVESLMLLWISTKTKEQTYGLFGLLGFALTALKYLVDDMFGGYNRLTFSPTHTEVLSFTQSLAITSLFVIGSFFLAYRLLTKHPMAFKYLPSKPLKMTLFMGAFVGAYLVSNLIGAMLFDAYSLNIFTLFSMVIIGVFSLMLSRSAYAKEATVIHYLFLGLLGIGFVSNLMHISSANTMISLVNFLVFMGVSGFIYTLAFKESNLTLAKYKLSDVMLVTGVGLLFIFLNVEVYHVVKLYAAEATKFAITLLWIAFGIVLFVVGIMKDIKLAKLVGTGLILLAILKAFFFDLAQLDSIYRIVLFLILGAILFGLSYFYQSKNSSKKEIK